MTNEMQKKLQTALASPEFYSGLCDCMESEKALQYFASHGLELSEREALEAWNTAMEESVNFGKLTDTALDKVTGGRLCIKYCIGEDQFGNSIWGCKEQRVF